MKALIQKKRLLRIYDIIVRSDLLEIIKSDCDSQHGCEPIIYDVKTCLCCRVMMALRACSVLRTNCPATSNKIFVNLCNDFTSLQVGVRCLHGPPKVNEHSDQPLYPPIPQFRDHKEAKVSQTKNFIAKLGTVEEKQFYLNKPKYYGWYSYGLAQDWVPCDAKPFLQFATQTHVVEGLPQHLNRLRLHSFLENILCFDHEI